MRRLGPSSYPGTDQYTAEEDRMNYLMLLQTMGLLGLRIRYWIIIIVVIIIIIALGSMVRGRSV
jgi:hypothetical protein